ncbi:Zn-dependent protease [Leucobacter sp. 7(1)]|uniref:DUF2268 domain-containing protein n=1 Tax=Leucobacter sp. 7(1) TaxID=1255613 RepID=UPI00097F6773|nr:DUF2268 domain-containing putative Zn-dependent protease [Leucobacter sp. 7(1)]SJN08086.1 Zn-dependent protease [Leucobacter sp. 7(1)]
MSISVIDTATTMRAVLTAPESARQDLLRELWAPVAPMYSFVPGGVDLGAVHAQNFGFPTAHSTPEVLQACDTLANARAWERIDHALHQGIAALRAANPRLTIPDLTVLLVLGDPSNPHFMEEVQGLSGFGGISGYIVITVWPTERILNRLEAIAVHELHHNLRYSPGGVRWDPQTVTVGEHIVSEGLADLFAVELTGAAGLTHFVSAETRADDAVLARVATGLDVTGMGDFAAWVLGDTTARLFGTAPVGLPTGAGYAAGVRIVQAYLATTGTTAAASLHAPVAEILRIALPALDLVPSRPATD